MAIISQSSFNDAIIPIITLIIGTFVGFLLSYLKDILNFKRTTAQQDLEQTKREALAAQKGFVKLYLLVQTAQNVASTIDRAFSRHASGESASMPDNQKFRGIVGLCDGLQRLDLDEIAFLFRSKHPFLFSDMLQLEKRIYALGQHLDRYTADRKKLVDLYEEHAVSTLPGAKHLLVTNIPPELQPKLDRFSASLDNTLNDLHSEANQCVETGQFFCSAFLEASNSEFRDYFPESVVLWETAEATNQSKGCTPC